MKFNKEKFKKNFKFFAIIGSIVIVLFVVSIIFSGAQYNMEVSDLEDGETNVNKLIMSEIMSSNKGAYADSEGNLYDYIEIYNGNNHDIDLLNYGLADTVNEVKWVFPDVTIKAKGYLVVFLCGRDRAGLYANFKIKSAGGETIALRKPNGKIIDAAETISLKNNQVMARNNDGVWVLQDKPTPGYANTVKGHEEFLKSLEIESSDLIINEVLPNNKGHFQDSYGEFSGYIEVKNVSDKTIDLENYSLGKEDSAIFKWQFPKIKLKKGEVVVVFTSNRNVLEGDELHTNFKLDNRNGAAYLSNKEGKIISKVEYEDLPNGMAMIKESKTYEMSNCISPGFANDVNGIKKFQAKYQVNPKELMINEAMNINSKYISQNGGEYYDWIELKNNSGKTINLKDYYLTTTMDDMNMYQLPDKELKKGEYFIIVASGDTKLSNSSYKHSNFKLSDTESIYLVKDSDVVDSMFMANVKANTSMGRGSSAGIFYINSPTPGKNNATGKEAISYTPVFNIESGIYNDTKTLEVEINTEGTIYYTLDGSTPSTSSRVYSSPLKLSKTTVVKAISYQSGKLASNVVVNSYIINEKHTLPVVSVSLNSSDLRRLNRNAWTEGYIVPAYAEYMEEGKEGFSIPCGLKLFGGTTRGDAKKSFELKFKKEFGAAKLNYQVFENRDFSSFDSIVLRTGSQDEEAAVIRDLVTTSLVEEYTDVDVQAYKSIILYINGSYWGVYFIREKIDETFVANHYNVSSANTDLLRIDGQIKSGSKTKWNNLMSYVKSHNLSNNSYYEEVAKKVDIENLIDFWIAEVYTANNDIVNCRYFSNPNVDDGKWKYIYYDLDFGMYNISTNYFNFSAKSSGAGPKGFDNTLLRNLMKNKKFKKLYVERLSYNLKNTWKQENVIEKIDEIYKEIEPEMQRNFNRWGGSMKSWKSEVDFLKTFARKRTGVIIKQAKSYFGLSNSDAKKYFG